MVYIKCFAAIFLVSAIVVMLFRSVPHRPVLAYETNLPDFGAEDMLWIERATYYRGPRYLSDENSQSIATDAELLFNQISDKLDNDDTRDLDTVEERLHNIEKLLEAASDRLAKEKHSVEETSEISEKLTWIAEKTYSQLREISIEKKDWNTAIQLSMRGVQFTIENYDTEFKFPAEEKHSLSAIIRLCENYLATTDGEQRDTTITALVHLKRLWLALKMNNEDESAHDVYRLVQRFHNRTRPFPLESNDRIHQTSRTSTSV